MSVSTGGLLCPTTTRQSAHFFMVNIMANINLDDIVGLYRGEIRVIKYHGRAGRHGHHHYLCKCSCGREKIIARGTILAGKTKTCGCGQARARRTHGGSRDNAYWSWVAMLKRCEDKKHDAYPYYGGRGISVCDRWKSYENFLSDMGDREKGLSIERIDSDGNYEPDNCVWANAKEQANNRRSSRLVEYEGEVYTCTDLANEHGVAPNVLNMRLFKYGWPIRQALGIEIRDSHAQGRDELGRFKGSG